MSDSEWVVGAHEAGLRLDKYLAAPGRLGSRAKAFAGLERGKVFLNGEEAGAADAARPLAAGQTVRVWMDRPGSANAAVFPVPVAACARRSRPDSMTGMVSRWTGVGSS